VILEGDEILVAPRCRPGIGGNRARMAVLEALKQAGLKRENLKAAVATGTLAVPSPRR